jgi:C-terminal processing protease CtpA/Prc
MSEDVRAARGNFGFRRVEILAGNIGLIELSEFADLDAGSNRHAEAARRVADAVLATVDRTDAVIFDLRSNGGGGSMADYLLSHFSPPGVILGELCSRTARRELRTLDQVGGRRRLDVPLYVLISGQTGSAAEFFAYALQSLRRATVVGEPSAGAANPGLFFEAGEGFTILVPLETPRIGATGSNWEGVGVQPDLAVDPAVSLEYAHVAALREVLRHGLSAAETRDARWVLEAMTSDRPAVPGSLQEFTGRYENRVVRVDRGELTLQRARWPARRLRPLDHDVFVVDGSPWRRIAFERQDSRVIALVELTSGGDETRWLRQPDVTTAS